MFYCPLGSLLIHVLFSFKGFVLSKVFSSNRNLSIIFLRFTINVRRLWYYYSRCNGNYEKHERYFPYFSCQSKTALRSNLFLTTCLGREQVLHTFSCMISQEIWFSFLHVDSVSFHNFVSASIYIPHSSSSIPYRIIISFKRRRIRASVEI